MLKSEGFYKQKVLKRAGDGEKIKKINNLGPVD